MRVNGSPPYCYDGCFSTTGIDRRTPDGKPMWETPYKKMSIEEMRVAGITEIGVLDNMKIVSTSESSEESILHMG